MTWGKRKSLEGVVGGDRPDKRRFQRVSVGEPPIELEVMIFGGELSARHPLVILSSIDLPMPPSTEFCEQMWSAGYQAVFCRRPGFGRANGLPMPLLSDTAIEHRTPTAAEAAIFAMLLEKLGTQSVTLMGLGTSNSICLRLALLSDRVHSCVFANPLFHPAIWDVIRPAWLRSMIKQTVSSRSGLKIAVRGLRAVLRRDPIWFYRQFAQKSEGDLAYISGNEEDFVQAGLFLQRIEPQTFFYDLKTSLIKDTRWTVQQCERLNAIVLCGEQTTPLFKDAIEEEAQRLGLPIVFAPEGDLFVPYASPDALLNALSTLRDVDAE